MIRYALACEEGHGFEAWFGSADDFDEQVEANAIRCPACGSAQVKKLPGRSIGRCACIVERLEGDSSTRMLSAGRTSASVCIR